MRIYGKSPEKIESRGSESAGKKREEETLVSLSALELFAQVGVVWILITSVLGGR